MVENCLHYLNFGADEEYSFFMIDEEYFDTVPICNVGIWGVENSLLINQINLRERDGRENEWNK